MRAPTWIFSFVLLLSGVARAELSSFAIDLDSPAYWQAVELVKEIHPQLFSIPSSLSSTTLERLELKFRQDENQDAAEFSKTLKDMRARVDEEFPGSRKSRDPQPDDLARQNVTVTAVWPKAKVMLYLNLGSGHFMGLQDRVEQELHPERFAKLEAGILPRLRAYGTELKGGGDVQLSDRNEIWLDLKSKSVLDGRWVGKPRSRLSRERAGRLGESGLANGSGQEKVALDGYALLATEYERATGKRYACEEGTLMNRTSWVFSKTAIQETQDANLRITNPALFEYVRGGALEFRVRRNFRDPVFSEFKVPVQESSASRRLLEVLKSFGFNLKLHVTEGKRRFVKNERLRATRVRAR